MDLVLRDIPQHLERALRELAALHDTTVEAEAVNMLASRLSGPVKKGGAPALEILARIEAAGIRTPGNSVEIIRKMRDAG